VSFIRLPPWHDIGNHLYKPSLGKESLSYLTHAVLISLLTTTTTTTTMDLPRELADLIKNNDTTGLVAKFTKRGRPRKGTRAVTQRDKDNCLTQAMPEADLDVIEALIRHGAKLTQSSFRKAIYRGNEDTAVLELMWNWGWRVDGKGLWYGDSAAGYVICIP